MPLMTYWIMKMTAIDLEANRKKFNDDFFIKGKTHSKNGELTELPRSAKLFDHVEYYETMHNGFVLVASPYLGYGDKSQEFADLGFSEVAPLYHEDAKTYVRQFDTRRDVAKFTDSLSR